MIKDVYSNQGLVYPARILSLAVAEQNLNDTIQKLLSSVLLHQSGLSRYLALWFD